MKDIEVDGAHITGESVEILKQWQVKTEPASACYIRVIERTTDDLTDEGGEPSSAEKAVRRIRTLCMMKRDVEKLSNP